MNDIVSFLNGERETLAVGYYLRYGSLRTLKSKHPYIYTMDISNIRSKQGNPRIPVLDEDQIDQINNSDRAKKNLEQIS